jgi:hypothetical protein
MNVKTDAHYMVAASTDTQRFVQREARHAGDGDRLVFNLFCGTSRQ